ncbi:MAG: radical SAM protein [Actinobacteria bacterium RBG_16_64_13]|nr:MAG: radical SAM protein [Actinobacteria bacterium RBG_16_64_13]
MIVRETQAKAILSVSKIYDYALNPYTGCEHACSYCYARFMKRFTGHREPWGEFVDAKMNAPELLAVEIGKKKRGTVWVSGVCDPYQPLEARCELTRKCLEILVHAGWPVRVQTRSPLVVRDMDILREAQDLEVGLSVTTADDGVRELFEPRAPAIGERLRALAQLHAAGIRTFVMIAPMLPGAADLPELLAGNVDYLLIDRMNYGYGAWVYRQYGLEDERSDGFFQQTAQELVFACAELNIPCRVVF